jgi:hypothetical protein
MCDGFKHHRLSIFAIELITLPTFPMLILCVSSLILQSMSVIFDVGPKLDPISPAIHAVNVPFARFIPDSVCLVPLLLA